MLTVYKLAWPLLAALNPSACVVLVVLPCGNLKGTRMYPMLPRSAVRLLLITSIKANMGDKIS
jgi:hypothetical protein